MRQRLPADNFLRLYNAFLRKHPELEAKIEQVIERIAAGDPTLRIHTLHGPLKGLYAARITESYRVVFALDAEFVVLINIGSHDDVY